MPELPEVQTIVSGLKKTVKNRRIVDMWTDWPKYRGIRRHVVGKKIIGVERRGKNIFFDLSDPLRRSSSEASRHLLLIHQKISGHLLVGKWVEKVKSKEQGEKLPEKWQNQKWIPDVKSGPLWEDRNRFIRLIFFLDNGKMLALSDVRRFAKVLCGPREAILGLPDIAELGPEALEISEKEFAALFENKKGNIKTVLMDQNFIAGIGNIYADEILWLAKIHPETKVEELSARGGSASGGKNLAALYRAMRKILLKAIKLKGSSVDDYRLPTGARGGYDKVILAYRRTGEKCAKMGCKGIIIRKVVGGRSAHFCSAHQKLKWKD